MAQVWCLVKTIDKFVLFARTSRIVESRLLHFVTFEGAFLVQCSSVKEILVHLFI